MARTWKLRVPVPARWIAPHAVIWLAVAAGVIVSIPAGDCTGLCAFQSALVIYGLVSGGLLVSAAVAVAELLWLAVAGMHHQHH